MVCKAWEEQYEDGRAKGLSQGILQGIQKGKQDILFSLVDDGTLTMDEAAEKVNMTKEAFALEPEKAGYKVATEV